MSLKKTKTKQGCSNISLTISGQFFLLSHFVFFPLHCLFPESYFKKKKKVRFVSVLHINMFPQKSNEL